MARVSYDRYDSDKVAKEYIDNCEYLMPPKDQSCFAGYEDYYNGKELKDHFYFGYYCHENIEKLIEEINKNLKNIKIHIVTKKLFRDFEINYFNGKKEVLFYFMRVELSEKYNQKSNFCVTLAMAQFIRGFGVNYKFIEEAAKVKEDFIDGMLEVFNKIGSVYGNWIGREKCDLETFMKLDDPKYVNQVSSIFHYDMMPLSSILIKKLKNEELSEKDLEDLEINEEDEEDW